MRISVLIACFNRRDKTLACLENLANQSLPDGFSTGVFVVDDRSTDGTADAIRDRFSRVRLLEGTGRLFWCGGMRRAWEAAAGEDPDFYLWLNDDTRLLPGAIDTLLAVWREARSAGRPVSLVVGGCRDPRTGRHVYGGQMRPGPHPAKVRPVEPDGTVRRCDTFQGNVVLIPREVFRLVGSMAPFTHALADTDYGYRTNRAGGQVLQTSGDIAECEHNASSGLWWSSGDSRRQRWRQVTGPKGLPPRDWWRFTRRHSGWRFPFHFAAPYLRVLLGVRR